LYENDCLKFFFCYEKTPYGKRKDALSLSIEDCLNESLFINSISRFKSAEEFFYDLKKLANICAKKNILGEILVKKNKIIITIDNKEYVYDNVNLKNLHEKILIHLNNML
jgi:hypothetical protein